MGNDKDNPDPGVFIVAVVLVALICLVLLRACDYLCKMKSKKQQDDDTDHLDPSIAVDRRNTLCTTFISCCLESPKKDNNSGRETDSVTTLSSTTTSFPLPGEERPNNQQVVPPKQSVDISNINVALKYLQNQQQTEDETTTTKVARIRLVQNILQLDRAEKPTEANLEAALIIGTDATSKVLGGYCINLREMSLEYYVIKITDFPSTIENCNDPVEVKTKNLLFALAVWSDGIRKLKRFRVYCDNNGILRTSEYDEDVHNLLWHFVNCEGITVANKDQINVNRMQDIVTYAKYIQPANDLSRWQVGQSVEFLCKHYGIQGDKVKGTVKLKDNGTANARPWYDPSDTYEKTIDAAQLFAVKLHCENCDITGFG